MSTKNIKHETPKQKTVEEPGNAGPSVQSILERGAETYGQAEQAVSNAYDKTNQVMSKTYEKTKKFSSENPRKALFIAIGIGVGVGYVLSAKSHHSRSGRYARPVINALSEIAQEFFR